MLCKKENFKNLDESALSKLRYIGFCELGNYSFSVPKLNHTYVEERLNEFLKDDCLMIMVDTMKYLPESSPLTGIALTFSTLPKRNAYIATISQSNDLNTFENQNRDYRPIALHYHCEPIVATDGILANAVDHALDRLKGKLVGVPLTDIVNCKHHEY